MRILPSEYIEIAKLFSLIQKLTTFDKYLPHRLPVLAKDHDDNTHKSKKLFSTLVPLYNLVDNIFDIDNNFIKEIQE